MAEVKANKSDWFYDLFIEEAKSALDYHASKGTGGGSGGIDIPTLTFTYTVEGDNNECSAKVWYTVVENNEFVRKVITVSPGSSGSLTVCGVTPIHIFSEMVDGLWGEDYYPSIATNWMYFVGGCGDDPATICVSPLDFQGDGEPLTITFI